MNNIVLLSDHMFCWICFVCKRNIQTIQEHSPQNSMIVIAKKSFIDKSIKMIFCSNCVKEQSSEVNQKIVNAILNI